MVKKRKPLVKVTFWVEGTLKHQLTKEADREGISFSMFMRNLLQSRKPQTAKK